MNIFTKIKNSFYNPDYYQEVLQKPFSYSLKYLLVFALLFALVFAIVIAIKFIPIAGLISDKVDQLPNYFPQELSIKIKDGKASTNVQEPYYIKMPPEFKNSNKNISGIEGLENLIVIDTKHKFDLDTFASYKTLSLLTAENFVFIDKDSKISIQSIANVKDFTLDRSKIQTCVNLVKPFVPMLYPIVLLGAYVAGYCLVAIKMVYLLFGALFIWLVAKIKGLSIGYKKSYLAGMHLVTVPIIITSLICLISPKFTFPFLFTIILMLFAALNLKKEVVS